MSGVRISIPTMATRPAPKVAIAPPVILTEAQLALREHVSARTIQRWRQDGEGPAFVRLGLRRVGYKLADVEAWESSRTFKHLADEARSTPQNGNGRGTR